MGDVKEQRELESIRMKRNANPKELFSQITAKEIKYRGKTSALIEKNKLINIILRAPDEYAQTIHTTRQLTKNEIPPREPTVKELRTAMYKYYQAKRSTKSTDQYNNEMSLYTGDNSDRSGETKKRWSNNKKSLRNNPMETRECYGCGKKGHIKRDCPSIRKKTTGRNTGNRSTLECPYCKKKGHKESDYWKKHPHKTPAWAQRKNKDSEIAGFAIDREISFMSVSDTIPVATVNEDEVQYGHESTKEDENSEESSEVGPSINWDLAKSIPEFQKTYQDEEGRQAKHDQEV